MIVLVGATGFAARGVALGLGSGVWITDAPSVDPSVAVGKSVGTAVIGGVGLGDVVGRTTLPVTPPVCRPPTIKPKATARPPAIRARVIARSQGVMLPRGSVGVARLAGISVVWVATGTCDSRACVVTTRLAGVASATMLTLVGTLLIASAGTCAIWATAATGGRVGAYPTATARVTSDIAHTKAPALPQRAFLSVAMARSSTGSRSGFTPLDTLLGGAGC